MRMVNMWVYLRTEQETHWPWSTSHAAPWRWFWPERCSETRDTSTHSYLYHPPQKQNPWKDDTHTVDWLMGKWSCDQQVKQKWPWHIKGGCEDESNCVCGSGCEHVKGREFYLSLPRWRGKRGRVKEKRRDSVSANRQRDEMKGEVEFNMLKG